MLETAKKRLHAQAFTTTIATADSTDEKRGLMCETTFIRKENGEMNIDYTYVNPVLRGQGVQSGSHSKGFLTIQRELLCFHLRLMAFIEHRCIIHSLKRTGDWWKEK